MASYAMQQYKLGWIGGVEPLSENFTGFRANRYTIPTIKVSKTGVIVCMSTPQWRKKNNDKLKAYRITWYRKNRKNAISRQKVNNVKRRKDIKDFIDSYTKPCIVCKESDKSCIDFHHIDRAKKFMCVATMAHMGFSNENILEEINKCCCLCANCHRKFHAGVITLPPM